MGVQQQGGERRRIAIAALREEGGVLAAKREHGDCGVRDIAVREKAEEGKAIRPELPVAAMFTTSP